MDVYALWERFCSSVGVRAEHHRKKDAFAGKESPSLHAEKVDLNVRYRDFHFSLQKVRLSARRSEHSGLTSSESTPAPPPHTDAPFPTLNRSPFPPVGFVLQGIERLHDKMQELSEGLRRLEKRLARPTNREEPPGMHPDPALQAATASGSFPARQQTLSSPSLSVYSRSSHGQQPLPAPLPTPQLHVIA